MSILRRVAKGRVKVHKRDVPDKYARDLIKRLLHIQPVLRIGGGPEGEQDLFNHPWFAGKTDTVHCWLYS